MPLSNAASGSSCRLLQPIFARGTQTKDAELLWHLQCRLEVSILATFRCDGFLGLPLVQLGSRFSSRSIHLDKGSPQRNPFASHACRCICQSISKRSLVDHDTVLARISGLHCRSYADIIHISETLVASGVLATVCRTRPFVHTACGTRWDLIGFVVLVRHCLRRNLCGIYLRSMFLTHPWRRQY